MRVGDTSGVSRVRQRRRVRWRSGGRRVSALPKTRNNTTGPHTASSIDRGRRAREKGKRGREKMLGVAHTHTHAERVLHTDSQTSEASHGLLSFKAGSLSQRAEITPQAKSKTARQFTPRRNRQPFPDGEGGEGGIHVPTVFHRAGFAVWVRLPVYNAHAVQRIDDEGAGRAV